MFLVQDYGTDLDWFTTELIGEIEKRKIFEEFEWFNLFSTVQAFGFKKGKTVYHKWRRSKLARIDEIDDMINQSKMTIFDRLIRMNRPKTIFDNLIKSKGK